ncbi:MAG: hypothetical protein V5B30_19330 [Candidatus Accumulibacter delftensis]
MSREVVVLSAVRSAIGTFGGSLANMEPHELAGTVMKESIARSGVDPQQITYVTVGNCIPTDSRFAYVSRVASIQAGLAMDSVAMAVNRLCASGLAGCRDHRSEHHARRRRLWYRRWCRSHVAWFLHAAGDALRRTHG